MKTLKEFQQELNEMGLDSAQQIAPLAMYSAALEAKQAEEAGLSVSEYLAFKASSAAYEIQTANTHIGSGI